ncbi:MAG: PAS domain-containing protein, partial [Desulfobulbaceae bacterium]|nr:PAS domain-containing protein [Desulfobulbaceae bacterium]
MVLGAALVALALPHARQSLRQAEPAARFPYELIVIFTILAAGILAAGYLFYRGYERRCRIDAERQLSAVAELKVTELVKWRGERLGDAGIIYQNTIFSTLVSHYLNDREDSEAERRLREWIGQYTEHYEYDQVRLLDPDGVTRLSVPAGRSPASAAVLKGLAEVLQTGRITIVDFYRHDHDQRIYLSVLIPILDASAGNRVIGSLSLRVDPEKYLFPFILHWPTPSQTAETLLVRREGDEVLYLNDLRFIKDATFKFRHPLARTDILCVMAVLGRTGIVEGLDCRGEVPVIADVRPVPDSPWFLVVRMNTSEVYAPAREHLWMILGLMTALVFSAGAGLAFAWRQQNLGFYRERLAAAEALGKSEKKLSVLNRIAEIFLLVTDEDMYVQVLEVMLNVTGSQYGVFAYLDEEGAMVAPSMTRDVWEQCQVPQKSIRFPRETWGDSIWGRAILEKKSLIKNAPGRVPEGHVPIADALVVPILFHGKVIGLFMLANRPGGYGQAEQNQVEELCSHIAPVLNSRLSRDRQEAARRQAEETLRESEERFRGFFELSADLVCIADISGFFRQINEASWKRVLGYSKKEILGKSFMEFIHPDDRGKSEQVIEKKLLRGETVLVFENRYICKDGGIVWLEWTSQPMAYQKGIFAIARDITERKKSEEVLHRSEADLRMAQRIAHVGNWSWDAKNDLVIWSEELYGIAGLDPARPAPTYAEHPSLYSPESWQELNFCVKRALSEGTAYHLELVMIRPSGEHRNTITIGEAVKDKEGHIVGLFGVVIDITERKQAEEKIKESEKRLRYAQQIAGLGFWDWNVVTGDLYWSDQTYIHYGFKPQEFVPTFDKFCSMVHPDDLAFVQKHVDASLQDDAEYDVEFRFVRPNGEMRYLYTRGDVTRDANGKAVRFFGSQIDITERKQA